MSASSQRPINLDITTLKFPLTAIVSILHRISGVILFLVIPILLCVLSYSLADATSFAIIKSWFAMPLIKLIVWGLSAALIYHLVAGIRHILMDLGYGESLAASRLGSRLVLGIAVLLILLMGVALW